MIKRIADFFEKFAVASLAIGWYKDGDKAALAFGLLFTALCLLLTKLEGKR